MNEMMTGQQFKNAVISGAHAIQNHRTEVDELNVFPVPDGDTGTNMSMTIGNAIKELSALPAEVSVAEAASSAAAAMLRGARGNSGVILSLLFRGFSKALAGKKEAGVEEMKLALSQGVDAAYKAVMKPTEGTMLTVARLASEAAAKVHTDDLIDFWNTVVEAAKEALKHTPEQLPILKKAGVVDAGGAGLIHIFEGMQSVLRHGKIVEPKEVSAPKSAPEAHTAQAGKGVFSEELNPDIENGYCTEFLVNKNETANAAALRAFLESQGDSVVVVEDDDIIKCHVHTEDPGKVLTAALAYGYLSGMKIENMHEQYAKRQAEGKALSEKQQALAQKQEEPTYQPVDSETPFGFVAVAAGQGLADVFKDLGAGAVVSGGQTMNPSTDDILKAVQSVPAETVFVLPNNKNIIMAAEQAGPLADRRVVVLPTRSVPEGMTAMLHFDPTASTDENTSQMKRAAETVSTGSITFAARNSEFEGHKIKKDELLAIENGRLAFTGQDRLRSVVKLTRSMIKKGTSFVTIISGADVPKEEAETVVAQLRSRLSADIELTHIEGGQPVYYYIVAVE